MPEFEDSGSYDFSPPEPVSPTYDVVNQQGQFTPTQAETGVPVQVAQSYTPGGDAYAPTVSSGGYASADVLNKYGQTTPYSFAAGDKGVQSGPVFPTVTSASPITAPGVVSPGGATGATGGGTTQPQDKGTDWSKIATALGLSVPGALSTLGKTALAGGLGAYGASTARKGADQVQAATQQQKDIGAQYTGPGQQLVAQAQRGELTPQSQQALEAAKAQINQGISNRGGVGQQQAANQVAALYNNLLDNQYKYGLNLMQIGDNITIGAIQSGLQLDTQLQTATNNFYTQLASMVGGTPSLVRTA